MDELVIDVETTISNSGNPFDTTNKLCYIGLKTNTDLPRTLYSIEYDSDPYRNNLNEVNELVSNAKLLIGFNIKFDLHWIRTYGIDFSKCRIWDCQLVHFIISRQEAVYPSLNSVAGYYGLGSKLDVISTEYWKNGIDTTSIPRELLEEYLQGDLDLTYAVYLKQKEYLNSNPNMARLCSLHNQDLIVLEEMEYNGMRFNTEESTRLGDESFKIIERFDRDIYKYHGVSHFNPNSNDHLSALLYGGNIKYDYKEECGVFKTGVKTGEIKYKNMEGLIPLPILVKPLKGSELVKKGMYSTDEGTLKSLRGNSYAKELIKLILGRSTVVKRYGTYYKGLVDLISKMNWTPNEIHGQFNQCVAITGRLSSTRPNLQNFDGEIKHLFHTRYNYVIKQ